MGVGVRNSHGKAKYGADFEIFRRTIHKNIHIVDNCAKNYFFGGTASKMPVLV